MPQHAVAADDRHGTHRLRSVGARSTSRCPSATCSARVLPATQRLAPCSSRVGRAARPRPDARGSAQAHAVLVRVEDVAPCRSSLVPPADADVAGVEHLAQLVADEVDDGLEVELGGHALLDAVDHRQLARCAARSPSSRRCVSSNRRAFSSATLMLDASGRAAGARRPRRTRARARSSATLISAEARARRAISGTRTTDVPASVPRTRAPYRHASRSGAASLSTSVSRVAGPVRP